MMIFFIKLFFNLYMFLAGCFLLQASRDDRVRELATWFCFIEKILGYIVFAIGVSIWFW